MSYHCIGRRMVVRVFSYVLCAVRDRRLMMPNVLSYFLFLSTVIENKTYK